MSKTFRFECEDQAEGEKLFKEREYYVRLCNTVAQNAYDLAINDGYSIEKANEAGHNAFELALKRARAGLCVWTGHSMDTHGLGTSKH